jgi:hypothetical protein
MLYLRYCNSWFVVQSNAFFLLRVCFETYWLYDLYNDVLSAKQSTQRRILWLWKIKSWTKSRHEMLLYVESRPVQCSQPRPRIVTATCQLRTRARVLRRAERMGLLQYCIQMISSPVCLLLEVFKIYVLREWYIFVAMYSPLVTICTTSLTFTNSTFCPHSVFVFCMDLRTNNDYFPIQH